MTLPAASPSPSRSIPRWPQRPGPWASPSPRAQPWLCSLSSACPGRGRGSGRHPGPGARPRRSVGQTEAETGATTWLSPRGLAVDPHLLASTQRPSLTATHPSSMPLMPPRGLVASQILLPLGPAELNPCSPHPVSSPTSNAGLTSRKGVLACPVQGRPCLALNTPESN